MAGPAPNGNNGFLLGKDGHHEAQKLRQQAEDQLNELRKQAEGWLAFEGCADDWISREKLTPDWQLRAKKLNDNIKRLAMAVAEHNNVSQNAAKNTQNTDESAFPTQV